MTLTDSSQPERALEKAPLFQNLTREQLRMIGQVSTQIQEGAGKVLAQQGHRGVEFVLVLDGKASVERDGHTVATIGPGDFYGEVSLIDGGPRTATVTSQTPMDLLVVDPRGFRTLLDNMPGLQRQIMLNLCKRLRELYASHTH
ncbi:MAG TPA: cyclic nucleotide-binding domain-containing protein [Tepidiformaceae bacterium]|nr:cyclic nucleotide-binding domain-containing protein [Tepidiformaceae bacterium]